MSRITSQVTARRPGQKAWRIAFETQKSSWLLRFFRRYRAPLYCRTVEVALYLSSKNLLPASRVFCHRAVQRSLQASTSTHERSCLHCSARRPSNGPITTLARPSHELTRSNERPLYNFPQPPSFCKAHHTTCVPQHAPALRRCCYPHYDCLTEKTPHQQLPGHQQHTTHGRHTWHPSWIATRGGGP